MKNRLLLPSLALACAFAAAAGGAELANPSFEEQGSQTDLAAGWSRWGDWMNRETGWQPTRSGSCLMGYHHWQIEGHSGSGFYQDVSGIEPGRLCTFTVYANADRVETNQNTAATIEIKLETTLYGEQSTVASRKFKVQDIAGGGEWSQLRVRAPAPTDVIRVLIAVEAGPEPRGGAVKFDDASLTIE